MIDRLKGDKQSEGKTSNSYVGFDKLNDLIEFDEQHLVDS
jgi:hypothetical protein